LRAAEGGLKIPSCINAVRIMDIGWFAAISAGVVICQFVLLGALMAIDDS
jgi:hypothetical protein